MQQSSVDKDGKEQLEIEITVDTDVLNSKEETERNFLLMAIAYAANIGGTGVVTGGLSHRRRIKTEEKANVVASV